MLAPETDNEVLFPLQILFIPLVVKDNAAATVTMILLDEVQPFDPVPIIV